MTVRGGGVLTRGGGLSDMYHLHFFVNSFEICVIESQ
jgi:hypothetical protein